VTKDPTIELLCRTQYLDQNERGRNVWRVKDEPKALRADCTALLLCDVWDDHWSRGASERVDAMVPRMNAVVHALRDRGVLLIHAPSGTMSYYADTPARKRLLAAPYVDPPPPVEHADPPLPIDDSDHGSDTEEIAPHTAWQRQHPGIDIDQEKDGISDDGAQIYAFLQLHGIQHLLIAGVHTNMCILNRSFGIKAMVKWRVDTMLVRDLTDAMYNPAMPPYVSHDQGTQLVIEYIEKFWCPTVHSQDLA
jgi:nicotinamidase-related amidase